VVVADDLRDAPRAAFKLPHADELRLAHNSVVLRERRRNLWTQISKAP
jgi:hypothetical protein